MKTFSKKCFEQFWLWINVKINQRKFGSTSEKKLPESLKNYAKLKEYKITLQWVRLMLFLPNVQNDPWKKIYQYMEDYGYKYIHILSQLVTDLNLRKKSWLDFTPKTLKKSVVLSILYSKPLRESRKLKFQIGDRVRISRFDLLYWKGYKLLSRLGVFEIVAISQRNLPAYTIKDEQDEVIRGNFHKKNWSKSFSNGIVSNRSFRMHLCNIFQTMHSVLLQTFYRSIWIWRVNGIFAIWEKAYPSIYQTVTEGRRDRRKFMFFDKKLSKLSEFCHLEPSL